MMKTASPATWALGVAVLLVGCGGGGTQDDAVQATQAETPRAVALSESLSAPIVVSASTWLGTGPDQALARMVVLVNNTSCGEFDVATTQTSYQLPAGSACTSVPSGSTVQVRFTNDADHRDLVVHSVTINGVVMAPTLADYVRATDGMTTPGAPKLFWNGELRFPYVAEDGYFVDSRGGSDQGSGSLGSPFKTLQQAIAAVNAKSKNLYLRCGGLWRETLKSAAFAANSAITSYGTAPLTGDCTAKPIISGAKLADGTTDSNGRVTITMTSASPVARVTVNGQPIPMVEWPSQAASAPAPSNYALAAGGSSNTLVMGGDAPSTNLVGAILNMRTRAYQVVTAEITHQDGAQLTFSPPLTTDQGVVTTGVGYVLQNAAGLLQDGARAFHQSGNQLHIATSTPNTVVKVEYDDERESPIYLGHIRGLKIRNIKVTQARSYGIVLSSTPEAVLDRVESSGNRIGGVSIITDPGSTEVGTTVKDSVFDDNWIVGIASSDAVNAVIRGNTVTRTGTGTPLSSKAAIRAGAGSTVEGNHVDGVTQSGILINPMVAATVSGNVIKNYCTRFSDCGAIYSANVGRRAWTTQGRVSIRDNIVGRGVANLQGAVGAGIAVVAGVYMDDFTKQIDITNNTIFGMPLGINLHNSSNNTVTGNKIWLTTMSGISASMDVKDGTDHLTGNFIGSNEIVPLNAISAGSGALPKFDLSNAFTYIHATRGISGLGSIFQNNTIYALNGEGTGQFATIGLVDANANVSTQVISHSEWRAYGASDLMPAPAVSMPLYSTQQLSLTFSKTFDEVSSAPWVYKPSATGGGGYGTPANCGSTGNCLEMKVGSRDDKVENQSSEDFPLPGGGEIYMTSYTARVLAQSTSPATPAVMLEPYLRTRGTPTTWLVPGGFVSDRVMSGAPGATIHYQALFQPLAGTQTVYGLQMKSAGTPVTIDNISVKKVTVTRRPVPEWATVVLAPPEAPAPVDCSLFVGGSGTNCHVVDLAGASVASVPAGTAKLLLKGP